MKAYELIEKPENWTQRILARDSTGKEVGSESPDAVCWCVYGAIEKCYRRLSDKDREMCQILFDSVGPIAYFNDTNTHEVVYNKLKELNI